ncbi:thylakoid membrane chloroplastic [Micractinium conductrix]|uniref:Thylakoid membrane chloroplastic n=1 Tax=Micractinium conductrix TaxID=554055 RepID=A0A2P6VJV0_9CHLO|nr:thylakoid membrane chloroplastic [Micractinium conductrix]|eukprot:PSC74363.1 thylakoid membrane chloroplastic [Micractinium conductrix]
MAQLARGAALSPAAAAAAQRPGGTAASAAARSRAPQHANLVAPAACLQLGGSISITRVRQLRGGLPGLQSQQQHRRAQRQRLAPAAEALSSRDELPPAIEGRTPIQEEAEMLKSLDKIEVAEPLVESRAEGAASTVIAALLFGVGVWAVLGEEKGAEYFAGYLLEQSLSVDNLFVFILVFNYFKTPVSYQNKVLTYGIATAAVLRLVLIVAGVDIVERFEPVLLLFAGILLLSSAKLLFAGGEEDEEDDLSDNKIVQFVKSLMSFSDTYDGDKFFTMQNGVRVATPLLLVLLVVELSDVVFAVDSIPAVFGVTLDPFIVYSSNLFAILSLRGLYGFVATFMKELRYLDKSVALVLGFVGAKIISDFAGYHVPTDVSLGVVTSILGVGVGASLLLPAPAESSEP